MNTESLRRLIIGERLPTERAIHQRLPKYLALPVFSSDAISSSAYAIEAILQTLVRYAGSGLILYSYTAGYIGLAIAVLFAMVAISYRQTVLAYSSGGGAYIVARENLGTYPGLLAAAALLSDYVMTVAVSVASGVDAIISAWPALYDLRVALCILFVALVTGANLRGAKESGKLFAGPTYLFVASMLLMIIVGVARKAFGLPPVEEIVRPTIPPQQALTVFLLLRAFASGCSALTGIEAISNGIPAFRPPESRNAAITLMWMAAICIALFFGGTLLAQAYRIIPDPSERETVVSMLGRIAFGRGFFYYVLQAATAAILILAANTSFADFPRLSAILARDRFAPRQLFNLGDRLVFSNGIFVLGVFASTVIVAFRGRTQQMIPLYAVGVFLSFTLSQAGMVIHWKKLQTKGWRLKAAVNALGALATLLVFIIEGVTKFGRGAWVVLVTVLVVILLFRAINRHYLSLGGALRLTEEQALPRAVRHHVLVLIPGVHRGVIDAVLYAKSISDAPEAVYVEVDPAETPLVRERWERVNLGMPLTILKSPWRSLNDPILQYIRTVRSERHLDMVTVVLPEFATVRWWHKLLHNQSGLLLKFALMFEPGVAVVNIRYHVKEP